MKSIINFFIFVFSGKHRKQKLQNELNWSEEQIKTITMEIASMEKILPGAPKSLRDDLKHNYSLLKYYKKRKNEKEIELKKELGLN